jgi:hypothetical protein
MTACCGPCLPDCENPGSKLLLTELCKTGSPEPAWLILLPATMVITWHWLQSRLPAFVAPPSPARTLKVGGGAADFRLPAGRR